MFTLAPAPTLAVGLSGHLKRHPLQDPGTITPDMLQAARAIAATVWQENGFNGAPASLLTPPDANTKIRKSARLVWSLTLAPAMSSGMINTCVRYADCHDVCVLTSGKGGVPSVQRARAARTALLYRAPEAFAVLVADEIDRAARTARRHDDREWRVRLNAASDIPWEIAAPWLIDRIRSNGGAAYDYTKSWARQDVPGYELVRSVDSRQDWDTIARQVYNGRNVAVILPIAKGDPTPEEWQGLPAIDGDVSDDRTGDPWGVVVILRAKGKLRNRPDHAMVRAV